MPSFKDLGQFVPTSDYIPADLVLHGGVNIRERYAVKPPNFRLRPPHQLDTQAAVSVSDIHPLKLHPGDIRKVTLPPENTVLMGAEVEFSVIDNLGKPVSLYGNDQATVFDGHPETDWDGSPWLIDQLHLTPEALRHQGEVGFEPEYTWDGLLANIKSGLLPVIEACAQNNLLLLPVGMLGVEFNPEWSNIAPHPYIASVHASINRTALTFDAHSTQAHVDLKPFGGISELGILTANVFNSLLSSMLNGLATSSPFASGRITTRLSNREAQRNALQTRGGVQDKIPEDGTEHLIRGHLQMQMGQIPVPERSGSPNDYPGNGSHKDTRPAKYSIGTLEVGSADMTPNFWFWISQMLIMRQFTGKVTEHVLTGEPLPSFLVGTNSKTRRINRQRSETHGNNARLITSRGQMLISHAWHAFLEWAKPQEDPNHDWEKVSHTINRMLSPTVPLVDDYLDPKSPHFLQGNLGNAMQKTAECISGSPDQKITSVNLAVAQGFMSLAKQV